MKFFRLYANQVVWSIIRRSDYETPVKDINKGIKRAKYIMPTLEEILQKLGNAKVFSVLDAKNGFCMSKLMNKSVILLHLIHRLAGIDG